MSNLFMNNGLSGLGRNVTWFLFWKIIFEIVKKLFLSVARE